jgi:general secretion pathway protein G
MDMRPPVQRPARHAGFTLIEMVITLAIIGILAAAAVETVELVVTRNREQELKLALREIRRAIDAYKQASEDGRIVTAVQESGYPPTLAVLVEGVADARSPNKEAKMYFLRRVPRDPMYADTRAAPEETWGLRSYASEADAPEPGKDVYDVYSRSEGTGLNGVPYRKW